jgi:hypothetical protein
MHFENEVFQELASHLGFFAWVILSLLSHTNVQVEAINNILKIVLQHTVTKDKSNWHHMIFFFYIMDLPYTYQSYH